MLVFKSLIDYNPYKHKGWIISKELGGRGESFENEKYKVQSYAERGPD